LLWDEVNTQAWVLLNKGATHFYSILGIKDWPFNKGGFGIEFPFLIKASRMCFNMGWSMPLGINGCSLKDNSKGSHSPKF
jgi:hypothetical protein